MTTQWRADRRGWRADVGGYSVLVSRRLIRGAIVYRWQATRPSGEVVESPHVYATIDRAKAASEAWARGEAQ